MLETQANGVYFGHQFHRVAINNLVALAEQ